MCKAPKVKAPSTEKAPKPEYLRNPYLDGADGKGVSLVNQLRIGRSSLRIDRAAPSSVGTEQPAATPSLPVTPTSPFPSLPTIPPIRISDVNRPRFMEGGHRRYLR